MNAGDKMRLAERAAREAGAFLLKRPAIDVTVKAEHDYVTQMDVACERMIRDALLSACPEDGFFGEETGEGARARGRWIVDPIDGTTNYIKAIPQYGVSIAYEWDGKLVAGAVFFPALGELFAAAEGEGATLNGRPIRVSGERDPSRAVCAMSFAHRSSQNRARMLKTISRLEGVSDLRRSGSAAYDLCSVACGRCDAFFELGLFLYDIAAGVVIVREAGGVVSGWPGEADALVTGNTFATNGILTDYLADCLTDRA